MRRFLILILWFLTIPCLLLLVSEIRERYVWYNVITGEDAAVCVGDSHAQPIKLDSGPTIAHGGDPFFIPYLTVKRLLELHHNNIRDVFLTVGPQSFSALPESRLREDSENWLSANGRRIACRLSIVDYFIISKFSLPILQNFGYEFSITDKAIASKPAVWEEPYRRNAEESIKRHQIAHSGWFQDSGLQAKHLNRLIELCAERQVHLYLVGTPLHESYRMLIKKASWEKYKSFLDSIETNHPHIRYLSYEEEDWPDSLFRDSDHLNSIGGALLGKRIEMTADALQLP